MVKFREVPAVLTRKGVVVARIPRLSGSFKPVGGGKAHVQMRGVAAGRLGYWVAEGAQIDLTFLMADKPRAGRIGAVVIVGSYDPETREIFVTGDSALKSGGHWTGPIKE
jgi:hypothetical protein